MNIRRANERDIAGINKLLYQVHRIHAEGRPDIFRLGNKKYNDEELCAIISSDNTPIFVAVDEGEKVLGYAFCIYEETKDNPSLMDRKTVYIDDLCVDATAVNTSAQPSTTTSKVRQKKRDALPSLSTSGASTRALCASMKSAA